MHPIIIKTAGQVAIAVVTSVAVTAALEASKIAGKAAWKKIKNRRRRLTIKRVSNV